MYQIRLPTLVETYPIPGLREGRRANDGNHQAQTSRKAREHVIEHRLPKIASAENGPYQLVDQPPIIFHVGDPDVEERVHEGRMSSCRADALKEH